MEVAAVALNWMAKIVQVRHPGVPHQLLSPLGCFWGIVTETSLTCTIYSKSENGMEIPLLEKGEDLGMGEEKNCVVLQLGSWRWNTKQGSWPSPYPMREQWDSRTPWLLLKQGTSTHSA